MTTGDVGTPKPVIFCETELLTFNLTACSYCASGPSGLYCCSWYFPEPNGLAIKHTPC